MPAQKYVPSTNILFQNASAEYRASWSACPGNPNPTRGLITLTIQAVRHDPPRVVPEEQGGGSTQQNWLGPLSVGGPLPRGGITSTYLSDAVVGSMQAGTGGAA